MSELISKVATLQIIGLMLSVVLKMNREKNTKMISLIVFFSVSILLVFVNVTIGLLVIAAYLIGLLVAKKSEWSLVAVLLMVLLAIGISFVRGSFVNVILLTGTVCYHCFQVKKQTTTAIFLLTAFFDVLMFFLYDQLRGQWQQLLVVTVFFIFVVIVNQLLAFLFKETDMIFARSLDQIMANYIGEVNSLYQNIRGWRHDYHNHLQAMKVYLDEGKIAEISGYLAKLEDTLQEVDQIVKSGNTMLDAIVNSKLSIAADKGISTNVKVFVGKQPLINDVDLCVILGNILDNAIEANEEIEVIEGRMLRVYISILKQQLYVSVTNSRPFAQDIANDYSSTKNDKRGLGIRRIDQLVEKYDGMINRQYEEEVFVTEVLLPLATISER